MGEDDGLIEQVAEFIQGGELAARAEARIDRQDATADQRRLHQQAANVVREHFDGV